MFVHVAGEREGTSRKGIDNNKQPSLATATELPFLLPLPAALVPPVLVSVLSPLLLQCAALLHLPAPLALLYRRGVDAEDLVVGVGRLGS